MMRVPYLLLSCSLLACGDDVPSPDARGGDVGVDARPDASGFDASSLDARGDAAEARDTGDGADVLVAVGYGGMRVRSTDQGRTWTDYTQLAADGGDDRDLLRGSAYGAGVFVAVGWRIFSSPDGAVWTERESPHDQWFGGVAFGNGIFLGVGGGGYCGRSSDGITWEACTDATDDDGFTHVRSVVFTGGRFHCTDADGVLRSTADGDAWRVDDADFGSPYAGVEDGEVVVLEQSASALLGGLRFRGTTGGIERAEGGDFERVFDIPDGNGVFQFNQMAFSIGR